eukprot:SAG31_NODE_954_length_10804_cov_3.240355_9_plen_145_part_00
MLPVNSNLQVAVTAFWVGVVSPVSDGEKDIQIKKKGCWQTLLLLYDRFPKFVLGFFLCSIAVTILATEGLLGQRQVKTNLLQLARQASDWWNIVGFVGLGLETDISELVAKMRSSGGMLFFPSMQMKQCSHYFISDHCQLTKRS